MLLSIPKILTIFKKRTDPGNLGESLTMKLATE
jgi:hypothetical protein